MKRVYVILLLVTMLLALWGLCAAVQTALRAPERQDPASVVSTEPRLQKGRQDGP